MTAQKTQVERIIEILERDGRISRNACLSMFISRLAARIADLEDEGWKFETQKVGGDYVYRVVERPRAKNCNWYDRDRSSHQRCGRERRMETTTRISRSKLGRRDVKARFLDCTR
jgi:hypothetical protein